MPGILLNSLNAARVAQLNRLIPDSRERARNLVVFIQDLASRWEFQMRKFSRIRGANLNRVSSVLFCEPAAAQERQIEWLYQMIELIKCTLNLIFQMENYENV